MIRPATRWIVTAAAGVALVAGSARADETRRVPAAQRPVLGAARIPAITSPSFYTSFLAPRIDARLHDESAAALDFTDPAANPWTRDAAAVERVERDTIRATRGALKRYAIERLGVDTWSLPLTRSAGGGLSALRTSTGGPRLRLGFAHLAPRAEVLLPTDGGRVAVSLDALGRVGASFETPTSDVRLGVSIDPMAHTGTLGLTRRF